MSVDVHNAGKLGDAESKTGRRESVGWSTKICKISRLVGGRAEIMLDDPDFMVPTLKGITG